MKKRTKGIVLICLMITLVNCLGCLEYPEINRNELKAVNDYFTSRQMNGIDLRTASSLNKMLLENIDTKEVRTTWQMIAEYVKSAAKNEQASLDYELILEPPDCVSFGPKWFGYAAEDG